MERNQKSTFFPWDSIAANGFIKKIKPSDLITSVEINNSGNCNVYLWNEYKLEPGASLQLAAQQNAYLSLTAVNVNFDVTGIAVPVKKLIVLAEKLTDI